MNKNLSKHNHVKSEVNHHNKTDVNKRKGKKVHQNILSCDSICKFTKEKGSLKTNKMLQKSVQFSNEFEETSKIFSCINFLVPACKFKTSL